MEDAGKVNVYTCQDCGAKHVTINAVDGVTPFGIACRKAGGCGGFNCYSAFYRVDQNTRPKYEWYKPSADDPSMKDRGVKDHVENGGLMLRRVTHETLERFGFGLRAG